MFILSLLVGSFLNVVIYRLPIMLERQWREQAHEMLSVPATDISSDSSSNSSSDSSSDPSSDLTFRLLIRFLVRFLFRSYVRAYSQ